MNVVELVVRALITVCLFVIFRWLIPAVFAVLGVEIPDTVVTALAVLIAVAIAYWSVLPRWPWRRSA